MSESSSVGGVRERWISPDGECSTILSRIGVREAKETLTRSLLSEIRAAKTDQTVGEQEHMRRLSALAVKSWDRLEQGELDDTHHSLLLKLIEEAPSSYTAGVDGGPASEGKQKVASAKASQLGIIQPFSFDKPKGPGNGK